MSILQNDIIYFILTDRFYGIPNPAVNDVEPFNPRGYHGGNIQGIIEKIPYLKTLGITALWITPVYRQIPSLKGPSDKECSSAYHGYWPLDFNTMDPHFYIADGRYPEGSKKYLRDLSDALHQNGIKLILDMVVNHTGYNHPGTTDATDNPTPIKPWWYNQRGLSCMDNMIEGELAALPDMNLDHPDVADYHIQTIIRWIEDSGIDAIRMDTVKHVERMFWNYFKTQIKGHFPEITLLGEVLEFDVDVISQYQHHWAFDSLFDFPLQQAMVDVFVHQHPLTKFVSPFNTGQGLLEKDSHYTNQNKMVTLHDNHDLSGRFMTFATQQQGKEGVKSVTLAMTFMFTVRGIPQLYYGNELGMEGSYDPDNRRDFEWFKLDEQYEVKPEYVKEKEIYDHTRTLIRLRKEHDALSCGNFISLYADDYIMAFARYYDQQVIVTVIHNGTLPMPETLAIPVFMNPGLPQRIKDLLSLRPMHCALGGQRMDLRDGAIHVKLESKSAFIFI